MLSENAVAVLRFRVKGWRFPVRDDQHAAFEELVSAGIMEPDGTGDYRFTDGLGARRDDILRDEEERIERERHEPPDTGDLSREARELLRSLVSGEKVEVDETTRPLYRELAAARILVPKHSFVGGWESSFRFTYWGWRQRLELAGMTDTKEPAQEGVGALQRNK